MRRRRLHPSFHALTQRGLVVLDGQQRVGAVFQHQCARGLGLGVQGLQADFATVQIELLEELAGHGDFIGFGVAQEVSCGPGTEMPARMD
jgi:hypothetical protein